MNVAHISTNQSTINNCFTAAAQNFGLHGEIKASKAQVDIHSAISDALENLDLRAKFDHRNDRFTFGYTRLGRALTAYVSVRKGSSC